MVLTLIGEVKDYRLQNYHFQMEVLVREMQDQEHGVPVRQQKMFLTSIPYAFMGN